MPKIRLYTTQKLTPSSSLELTKENAHYLSNVMRQKPGYQILFFNGHDGEWLGEIDSIGKKSGMVKIIEQTRKQTATPDIWLCFAPVKNAPINNLIQKATELGVSKLQPVLTERTVATRVNTERLKLIAIEAAEQSHRLTIPDIEEPVKLANLLSSWNNDRGLILCDESGGGQPFSKALHDTKFRSHAIIIGPEGGFSQSEFDIMRKKPYIMPVGMGPRILRADTAALAALTCYQNILGDWDEQPHFRQD